VNQLSLSWGVKALFYDKEEGLDEIINDQIQILKKHGFVQKDDVVVNTGSTPVKLPSYLPI
jgi:pyruvate kinase